MNVLIHRTGLVAAKLAVVMTVGGDHQLSAVDSSAAAGGGVR
jgi:hypothetical protein